MIFVTVGTHSDGFDRLVRWMDEIAAETEDDVLVQVGHTPMKPKNADWFEFKDIEEIIDITERADIVVGHGGAGTILTTLETGTPIVCVPRLEEYDEIYDDHQLELTHKLAEKGTLAIATSKDKLREQLSQSPDEIAMDLSGDLVPYLNNRLAELEDQLV